MGDGPLQAKMNRSNMTFKPIRAFWHGDGWNVDKLKWYLPDFLMQKVMTVPFAVAQEDSARWVGSSNGTFLMKEAWQKVWRRAARPQVLTDF